MERLSTSRPSTNSAQASYSAGRAISQRPTSHPILFLQQTLGNRAVQRLLRDRSSLTKLSAAASTDRHSSGATNEFRIARNVFDAIKKFFNPPPQLRAKPSTPQLGNCGELRWTTNWELSKYGRGGFIIQKVNWKETLQRSFDHPWGEVYTKTYYEAWWVVENGKTPSNDDADPDTFGRKIPHDAPRGTIEIDATAQYHDNVEETELPADMKRLNQDTNAGPLRSSLNDPNLGGTTSAPIPHYLKYDWDCFDENGQPTVRRSRVVKRIP